MNHFHRVLALTGWILLPGATAMAQKPVKQDLMLLLDKVPAPLSAPSCSAKLPATYSAFKTQLGNAGKEIALGRTATQAKDEAAMQAMGNKMQADGVENMSEEQQKAYAMQNMASMPGMNPQSAKLAQMMQDPAFQAKLAKMSDQEKAVFMQKMMAPPNTSAQRMVNDPSFQAAQGEFMQQMQNPTFAAAWKKKSQAEQDAYMKQLMQKHGLNEARMQTIAGKQAPGTPPPAGLVTSKALEEMSKLTDPANKLSAEAEWVNARQQYQNEVDAIQKSISGQKYSNTVPPCPVQQANYDRGRKALQQRMDAATKYLSTSNAIWMKYKAQQKARLTPFNAELARIHYGDDIRRPEEQASMAPLASGQQLTIGALTQLADYSEASYEINKEYCSLKAAYDKPFVCEQNTCFPAPALVTLADGSRQAIASIKAGTLVQSYDAATGRLTTTRVTAVQVHADQEYTLLRLRFATPAAVAGLSAGAAPMLPAAEVLATPNHPFITAGNEAVRADELTAAQAVPFAGLQGMEAAFLTGRTEAATVPVVYNLQTEAGNYFVEGMLVGSK
jgi:hypothetical protein